MDIHFVFHRLDNFDGTYRITHLDDIKAASSCDFATVPPLEYMQFFSSKHKPVILRAKGGIRMRHVAAMLWKLIERKMDRSDYVVALFSTLGPQSGEQDAVKGD